MSVEADAGRPGRDGLRVLVVDDEQPALDEMAYLLGRDERVGRVLTCTSGAEALRLLGDGAAPPVDVVLLDVQMPGLTGLDLAGVLGRFRRPPHVVFVTAHTEHAVEAFDLRAVDYLLKPVRQERLREALRRVLDSSAPPPEPADEQIPVELGGVTRFVARSEIRFVEAQGDYARLHTADDSHLIRVPLSALEKRWEDAGFLRIHRSLLVAMRHVESVRQDDGHLTVQVGARELTVSRRHAPALREQLRRLGRSEPSAP